MSTYSDVVAAVKTRLDTVTNIGATHARTRWSADWASYLDQFKVTISSVDQIRGWVVTLDESNPIAGEPFSLGNTLRTYNVVIHGILGFSDSNDTETTFLNLVETVMNDLDGRKNLSVAGVIAFSVGPSVLRTYQMRTFGSILCHYAVIALPVMVEAAVSYA